MSPLDDELRAALRARADVLAPSPDPLAGIEARATGMRRRRVVASVAGAGLAAAAIAFAVPSVLPAKDAAGPGYAAPSATPASYALDPAQPWAPRGSVDPRLVAKMRAVWAGKHPGTTFSVLFGQRLANSQQDEVVFVSDGPAGARYGLAWAGDLGRETFAVDLPLPPPGNVLAFRLPGEEAQRVLAVADPRVSSFTLGAKPMTALASGVVTAPFAGGDDTLLVKAPDGTVLFDGRVPEGEPTAVAKPTNLLTWPPRGSDQSALLPAAKAALAGQLGTTADQVELNVLFSDAEAGLRFLTGQVWKRGVPEAYSFAYAEGGTGGPEAFLGPMSDPATPAVVSILHGVPQTGRELLVVVPVPGTGQVSYDSDDTGPFQPVTGQDQKDGVVTIDRTPGDTGDRLEILDGNGNLDKPTYRGSVLALACGRRQCS